MKIKGFFIGIITSILIFSFNAFAAFNDAGTEYSNQGSDTWVQDRAGDGLKMVNAFVCIVRSSNGGTRPNTTWKALIDEVTCDLANPDSEGGGGAVSYAEATMVSTRASDVAPQEMKAYLRQQVEKIMFLVCLLIQALQVGLAL